MRALRLYTKVRSGKYGDLSESDQYDWKQSTISVFIDGRLNRTVATSVNLPSCPACGWGIDPTIEGLCYVCLKDTWLSARACEGWTGVLSKLIEAPEIDDYVVECYCYCHDRPHSFDCGYCMCL